MLSVEMIAGSESSLVVASLKVLYDSRCVLLAEQVRKLSELALRYFLKRQFSENHDFVVIDVMVLDLKDPLGIEAFVEPLAQPSM